MEAMLGNFNEGLLEELFETIMVPFCVHFLVRMLFLKLMKWRFFFIAYWLQGVEGYAWFQGAGSRGFLFGITMGILFLVLSLAIG